MLPLVVCSFVNESGEDVVPGRVEELLVYGTILHDKYSIRTIVNGIEIKDTELEYSSRSDTFPACLVFCPMQVLKQFTPEDKQLNIEYLVKFPALFLDEEVHSIKHSVKLLPSGDVEYTDYLYFDQRNIYKMKYMNNWQITIK